MVGGRHLISNPNPVSVSEVSICMLAKEGVIVLLSGHCIVISSSLREGGKERVFDAVTSSTCRFLGNVKLMGNVVLGGDPVNLSSMRLGDEFMNCWRGSKLNPIMLVSECLQVMEVN